MSAAGSRPGQNGLGERIDTGGQFLCDDMPEVMALARRFGKTLVETFVEGRVHRAAAMSAAADELYGTADGNPRPVNAIDPDDPAIAALTVAEWLARQNDRRMRSPAFRLDDRRAVVPGARPECRSGI